MRHVAAILCYLLLAASLAVSAQPPLSVQPVGSVHMAGSMKNLSMVDGNLYAYSSGVLLQGYAPSGVVLAMMPDTLLATQCPGAEYVVRNAGDGSIYYLFTDASKPFGLNVLNTESKRPLREVLTDYIKSPFDPGRKNKPIELRAWFREVCHPTFSPDGTMMVFSSQGKVGLGGYDLWCSFWNGHRWSKPINMGAIINTQGHEITPLFYGNYLIFASNGHKEESNNYALYAVSIKKGSKTDDVIFNNYVVQPLPTPLSSEGDNMELAYDRDSERGYWLTTRNGREELYTFEGRLDGVMLTGLVRDDLGKPVPQATVSLLQNGRRLTTASTDSSGTYRLYAMPGSGYVLQAKKTDYFTVRQELALTRMNEELLMAPQHCNLTLSTLPFNRPMLFDNIYRSGADVELSSEAIRVLDPILDFLRDNPHVTLQLTLYCTETDDWDFNDIVISRRIKYLQQYFESRLPKDRKIRFQNGNHQPTTNPSAGIGNAIYIELFK